MDVISLSVDIDKSRIDSRYRFAIAVAQRAKQLNEGAIPTKKTNVKKITTLALEEVATGSVHVLSGEAAVDALKEAGKSPHKNIIDEAQQKMFHTEDLTELEKDLKAFMEAREINGSDGKDSFPEEDL